VPDEKVRDDPGLPVKFSRWVGRSEIAADRLGEHNADVLRELLSLTDQEITELYANKVLVRDPLLDRPPHLAAIWARNLSISQIAWLVRYQGLGAFSHRLDRNESEKDARQIAGEPLAEASGSWRHGLDALTREIQQDL
jgi:hypothetical protein